MLESYTQNHKQTHRDALALDGRDLAQSRAIPFLGSCSVARPSSCSLRDCHGHGDDHDDNDDDNDDDDDEVIMVIMVSMAMAMAVAMAMAMMLMLMTMMMMMMMLVLVLVLVLALELALALVPVPVLVPVRNILLVAQHEEMGRQFTVFCSTLRCLLAKQAQLLTEEE